MTTAERISLDDVEQRLRALTSGAQEAIGGSKQTTLVGLALAAIAAVAGTYLYGRRRGRKRASVLEIRRI